MRGGGAAPGPAAAGSEAESPTADWLRIATFNLENLGDSAQPHATLAERVRLLRPQLLRLRADVLCLQEVDAQRGSDGEPRRLDALDALIAGTPYAAFHRLTTFSRSHGGPRDKHNVVILSRLPIVNGRQILHDLVQPPLYKPATGDGATAAITWDRPILHATLQAEAGWTLDVVNVHLRAPRAAFIEGGKASASVWRTMSGWAEGFFLAAVKAAGQALEVRLLVDQLFDADPEARIVVCGDFNADSHEAPVRTIRGDEEDAGNAHLAFRTLVPAERSLADSRRFSVLHHGRPRMLDHLLLSRALLAWYCGMEVHNEALGDEAVTPQALVGTPASFHAPLVAEFRVAAD
ncbi:MAG TPA: endonuclease/exonuclease/phosphatase family protein [Defluviicoccus sp.]|nr:endonuclease/exonuclease/phosphatase family protein [Defluviicoccus sp.]